MTKSETSTELTPALEDYLETVFLLERDKGSVRVRDIASAREVKSSSVSPALKRLAELGMVKYIRREFIGLTQTGKEAARRIVSRHDVLSRFFNEVLQMDPVSADREACAMEHSLSPKGMDKLVRFFEFFCACPEGHPKWLDRFHRFNPSEEITPDFDCQAGLVGDIKAKSAHHKNRTEKAVSLLELEPGEKGKVRQVKAEGAIRQRLLDMGLLPEVELCMERLAPTGDPIWISFNGSQLALRRKEAESVLITKE